MKFHLSKASLFVFLFANLVFAQTFNDENPAGRTGPGMDLQAYEVFYSMFDQSIDLKARELTVLGTDRKIPISFGAEKEGSSSKILRVMSPSSDYFFTKLEGNPKLFIWFIKGVLDRSHLSKDPVIDSAGEVKELDQESLSVLRAIDWSKMELGLDANNHFIDDAQKTEFDNAIGVARKLFPIAVFSFLKTPVRRHLWDIQRNAADKTKLFGYYDNWVPLFGEAEKYIYQGHRELNDGWEVIFKPQNNYADFEKQMLWFRTIMGSKFELFEAPGHQRVVMPKIQLLPHELKVYNGKAAEVSRMILAYLVLRGLKGKTGILGAKHKAIPTEDDIANLSTGRGPIRLEKNRFYRNSIGVEFRTGMKDEVVRRFVQAVYASRLATNDMGDLKSIHDWNLIPKGWDLASLNLIDPSLDSETYDNIINNWRKLKKHERQIPITYFIPLWNWESAPFAQGKKQEIARLRKEFIAKFAAMENPTYQGVSTLLSDWVTGSNLLADIENYITPKRSFDRVTSPLTVEIKPGGLDVNKIDLGNEFTARMPLKLKAVHNNGSWLQTVIDMTPEEREARIKGVALSLQEQFTGGRGEVTRLGSGSHGHSLNVAYELKDAKNRTWRVEWDGVGRNYDQDGNILEQTARGGHIEIVSPKYNPTLEDIKAVYTMMESESLVPDYKMGGSHINIDFEIFEKNPKALARFLTLFHQHRGIISFMFQHINRLRSAEPVDVTTELDLKLRNFDGSKDDLSKLLYDSRYFNSRQNRKTRYTQIDVSNYLGSVIPTEFVKPDFDVVKARFTGGDGWSRQFRVTPHKKFEFRLFDAAKDPVEAALQIKVVRSLLNKALNDSSPLSLPVQMVDHEAYVKNPARAYSDLNSLVKDLSLNYSDYSPFVTNKILINKSFMEGKHYINWFTKAAAKFPKVEGWGRAQSATAVQSLRCNQVIRSAM